MNYPLYLDNTGEFVIQKHIKTDQVHWDLMLQAGNVLRTFRLQLPPKNITNQPCVAVKISDHPLKFLTYEGAVNEGTGKVKIEDKGTYQLISKEQNTWRLLLDGQILSGKFTLTFIEGDNWQFSLS